MGNDVRHQRNFEAGAIDPVHRQADAVDADRAFPGHVAQHAGRRLEAPALGARVRRDRDHLPHPVNVAADQVSAEAVIRAHGAFEVQRRPRLQATERGQRQGFVGSIGMEGARVEFHHRQAHPVDRDALAQTDLAEGQRADLDRKADVAAAGLARGQAADAFDDSGKHQAPSAAGSAAGVEAIMELDMAFPALMAKNVPGAGHARGLGRTNGLLSSGLWGTGFGHRPPPLPGPSAPASDRIC